MTAKAINRLKGAGDTCVAFHIGLAFVWWSWGFTTAVAVAFIGYACVGELQRKTNQIIDAIERSE